MNPPAPNGLLVLDKPVGVTSRAAVDRALRWFPRGTRVGHTGTLDPLAGGVLVLCVGHSTRLTEYVQDMAKTYVADVVLGARSATDDAEGPITPLAVSRPPSRAEIDLAFPEFVGRISQIPPAYSAAKVAGQRAYDLARRDADVALRPRTVVITRIDILAFDYPNLRLEVQCGKGTYIRSLARDLGERLGCGGYVRELRRTRVGPFTPADAIPLDTDPSRVRLLPPAAAVTGLQRVTLSQATVARLRNGQRIEPGLTCPAGADVAVFDEAGALVAVAVADAAGRTLNPSKVFPA
jgi:tRNA pseudouridine55 synthase